MRLLAIAVGMTIGGIGFQAAGPQNWNDLVPVLIGNYTALLCVAFSDRFAGDPLA
jgi:hypothetical protein